MTDNLNSLSVIIPTYNSREETLATLRSVLEQPGCFEVIVVDDASVPAFELPDNIPQRISLRLVRHETNRGAAAARNSGIGIARGEWVCLLDGDDLLLADTLSKRFEFAVSEDRQQDDTRPVVYACGWKDNRAHWRKDPVRIPNNGQSLVDFCSGCWFSPGSTLIARKQLFEDQIGNFDENLRRLEDMDWFIRLGKAGGRLKVQPLVGLDILPGNKPSLATIFEAGRHLRQKHLDLQRHDPAAFRYLEAYLDLEFATYAARERRYVRAAAWFLRSLFLVPRLKRHLSPGWQSTTHQS